MNTQLKPLTKSQTLVLKTLEEKATARLTFEWVGSQYRIVTGSGFNTHRKTINRLTAHALLPHLKQLPYSGRLMDIYVSKHNSQLAA